MKLLPLEFYHQDPEEVARGLLGRWVRVKSTLDNHLRYAQLTKIGLFKEPNPRAPTQKPLAPGTVLLSTRFRGNGLAHVITGERNGISHVTLWKAHIVDEQGREGFASSPGVLAEKLGISVKRGNYQDYHLISATSKRFSILGSPFPEDTVYSTDMGAKDYPGTFYWSYGVHLLDR